MSQKRIVFTVEGMSCGGCVSKIKQAADQDYNGLELDVDLESKRVELGSDSDVTPVEIKKMIEGLGFQVSKMEMV